MLGQQLTDRLGQRNNLDREKSIKLVAISPSPFFEMFFPIKFKFLKKKKVYMYLIGKSCREINTVIILVIAQGAQVPPYFGL